jgi:hypothetical protein
MARATGDLGVHFVACLPQAEICRDAVFNLQIMTFFPFLFSLHFLE